MTTTGPLDTLPAPDEDMISEYDENPASPSRRYRGPQGLGEEAARELERCTEAGGGVGELEEAAIIQRWAEDGRFLIPADSLANLSLISDSTSEHEVRYRPDDDRAVKMTLPGTFGFVPKKMEGVWRHSPATPREYLLRVALQNGIFADDIRLEGAILSTGKSMIIGQPDGGLSLVIS